MRRLRTVLIVVLFCAAAFADTITGTVTNGSTSKPAAGVSVTLVDPMGGMAELATAKTDAQGRFKLEAPAAKGPRLARAEKGGVNYFKMITSGSTSIDLEVYEAAATVEGISGAADVVKMQAQGSVLQAVELFAVRNASNPPRTLASKATFEFVLPEGAQIDGADVQGPNGQPISASPTPGREKNHYTFAYSLKPGETRFQVSYHMPYSGQASFAPQMVQSFDHYVLVVPSTMSFVPKDAKQFQPMTNQPGSTVEVSLRAKSGQELGYSLSGTGTFPEEDAQASGASGGGAPAMGGSGENDNRPGGGLGKPIDAPDGLAKYRWYILGVLLTVLVGGGIWTHERTLQDVSANGAVAQPLGNPTQLARMTDAQPALVSSAAPAAVPQPAPSDLLLAALKEELFQLEVERQQGKLSVDEYDKARSALEQTLQRALQRRSS
jgi:hypothetical protein